MSPIVAPVVVAAVVGSKAAVKIVNRVMDDRAGSREAAVKMLDGVVEERAAARQADTRQAQLGHERRVRELEQRLDRTVRAMPPAARREFERAQARTMEHEHTR